MIIEKMAESIAEEMKPTPASQAETPITAQDVDKMISAGIEKVSAKIAVLEAENENLKKELANYSAWNNSEKQIPNENSETHESEGN